MFCPDKFNSPDKHYWIQIPDQYRHIFACVGIRHSFEVSLETF